MRILVPQVEAHKGPASIPSFLFSPRPQRDHFSSSLNTTRLAGFIVLTMLFPSLLQDRAIEVLCIVCVCVRDSFMSLTENKNAVILTSLSVRRMLAA